MLSVLANPVCHSGAMVKLQSVQRPIGIGQHVDSPLRGDQDGEIRRSVAGLDRVFSSFEQLHRVVHELAHNLLIETEAHSLRIFSGQPNIVEWNEAGGAI